MSLSHNTDHAQQTVDLLLQQFKGKPNWEALLRAWAITIQEVEDMLYDLFTKRSIDTAVGEQLDILGVIVGVSRGNRNDDVYRIRLKVQIRMNVSCGTPDDILAVVGLLSDLTVDYRDVYPAAFVVEIDGAIGTEAEANEIAEVVAKTRSGGVNGQVISNTDDEDHVFRLADGTTMDVDADRGFFDYDDPWVAETSASARAWISVCRAPEIGRFVGIATDGTSANQVMYSDDGNTWHSTNVPTARFMGAVCWSPERAIFCIGTQDGYALTSPNGIDWTETAFHGQAVNSICWAAARGIFCAVGDMDNVTLTSVDGTAWIANTGGVAGKIFSSVCWAEDIEKFCAVGDAFAISDDGATWIEKTRPVLKQWTSVVRSVKQGLFCAVTVNSGFASQVIAFSEDGNTWTLSDDLGENADWSSIVDADGVLIAVSSSGVAHQIMLSLDAIYWFGAVAPNAQSWATLCWAPDLEVALALANDGTASVQVMKGSITGGDLAAVRLS